MDQRMPALLLPLFALVFGACDSGPPPQAPQQTPEVPVVTLRPEPIPVADRLPGRVSAVRTAEVRPQVGGIVLERRYEEGSIVEAGDPLYQIDPSVFKANVAAATATLSRARASLKLAENEAARAEGVRGTGAISEREIDAAVNQAELARAEVAQARAALTRAQLDLKYATVRAPISGRIGISRVTEGALVGVSDPQPLTTIHQIDQVYVDMKQPVSSFEYLRRAFESGTFTRDEGLPVTLESSDGQDYEERGRLLFTDLDVDESTSEVTLRVIVENPEQRLLPGMFVRARIVFGEDPRALAVPQQAVQRNASLGAFVLVVNEDGTLASRPVVTGRVLDGRYVIQEGLTGGERVVVEGADRLRAGATVRPVPWRRGGEPDADVPAPPEVEPAESGGEKD